MRLDVVSLFPDQVSAVGEYGVTGRAISQGLASLRVWNPRDFAGNRDGRVDDRSYGGGPGMVMQSKPLVGCLAEIARAAAGVADRPVLLMSPQGRPFDQALARRLAVGSGAVIVCGRYEGIDQRFIDKHVDLEVSAGDFVLSGGELPAMMIIDALVRLLPGALGDDSSAVEDSFTDGLLDHPHYTRPAEDERGEVPSVLLSGDHQAISRWRLKQALGHTWLKRPALLDDLDLSAEAQSLLREFMAEQGRRELPK